MKVVRTEEFTFRFMKIMKKDKLAAAKILTRLDRVEEGNFGDHKSVGDGVWELRLDYGPAYRVYYALRGETIVILLFAGDKTTQAADIKKAKKVWNELNNI